MYSSGYSQVSKSSPQALKKMQYRSKGKSCGYYMRIVFFFSSLIQSLIIVSLVLFLVYGKTQDSASTSRIQDLEESFSRLSIENVALRKQRKNLTNFLNTTLTEKARNDWDLNSLRYFSNISSVLIQDIDKKLQQCYSELFICNRKNFNAGCQTSPLPDNCNCGLLTERLKARLELVESNFTQTGQRMRMEMDQTAKERDNINLEVIRLRREKSTHEKEVAFFRQKCKDDFAQSLMGISNVSKAFLNKISSLFPSHIAFQLTCTKQREHLEQIRTNCTSLSREVEDKFQRYLNNVGEQVSIIQGENSRFKAENWRLSDDYRWCSTNRTGMILQHKQNLDKLQRKHDEDKEKLLMDKLRLNGDIEVLNNNVKYKTKAIDHLTEQIKQLNMSCTSKTGFGGFSGGSTSRLGTQSQPGWSLLSGGGSSSSSGGQLLRGGSGGLTSSLGSYGSALNKLGSTGTGSSSTSLLSSGSSNPFGSALNKLGSTGTGSSSTSLLSSGSSNPFGSALNKLGSTGTGSSSTSHSSSGSSSSIGSTLNKLGSTGTGSSSLGSTGSIPNLSSSGTGSSKPALSGRSSSSLGTSSGSSGIGSNKPTSSVKSPSSSGSTGSTGSTSKSGSTGSGFSWWGSSNTGQSKSGSGTGKVPSTGNSGSSIGTGRTSGLGGGSISVAQHLKDLQRIINPSAPEEKQDLSRLLG